MNPVKRRVIIVMASARIGLPAADETKEQVYEDSAWVIAKQRGTGPNVAVLDEQGFFPVQGAACQKNLHQ